MFGKRNVDDLSVEELEKALRIRRRQARMDRFRQMSEAGHTTNEALTQEMPAPLSPVPKSTAGQPFPSANDPVPKPERPKKMTDGLLLGLEVAAVIGLVIVLAAGWA